jgi:endonuclease-3 related protein
MFVIDADTRGLFARLGLIVGDKPYDVIRGQFERALDRDVLVFKEFRALMVVHETRMCAAPSAL